MSEQDFLRKLVENASSPRRFASLYQLPKSGQLEDPYDLFSALDLQESTVSDLARETHSAIEEVAGQSEDWLDFRWKLTAHAHLQDIFDASLFPPNDHTLPIDPLTQLYQLSFQQYYFYFESRILLREAILAGLNGLYAASDTLLRPFLEFSATQNYYYRMCHDERNYQSIEKFMSDKRPASWKRIVKYMLPKDSFCQPIRYRVKSHHDALSSTTQHTYHSDLSSSHHRQDGQGPSIEGIFFWQKIRLIVDAVLWVYYANFPLLFHPVDTLRKFGFNGPVGLIADPQTAEAVKRSLRKDDYDKFQAYSSQQEATTSVLSWVASQPDLSDDQIRTTWFSLEDRPCPPDFRLGFAERIASLRALRAATALPKAPPTPDIDDDALQWVWSLKRWSDLSRKIRTSR